MLIASKLLELVQHVDSRFQSLVQIHRHISLVFSIIQRQIFQTFLDICPSRKFLSPIHTLRRDIGRGDDTHIRIDKEKHHGARPPGLSLVLQLEVRESVFYIARVHDHSTYVGADRAWVLDGRLAVFQTVDLFQPDKVVWLVLDFCERVGLCHVAELHGRVLYVVVLVWYECCGADVLVLVYRCVIIKHCLVIEAFELTIEPSTCQSVLKVGFSGVRSMPNTRVITCSPWSL